MTERKPLFPLGRTVATPNALDALERVYPMASGGVLVILLTRHHVGDWGDVSPEDADANDKSVRDGERVLSSYPLKDGTRIWIITEADRSVTTVLLPEDY